MVSRTHSKFRGKNEGVVGNGVISVFFMSPICVLCCVRPPTGTSQNATVTVSTYLLCTFSCLCDWLSKGRFSCLVGEGLCPKTLALEPSIIVVLGISRVCICHLLSLFMGWWFEFFHLGTESWLDSISASDGESGNWFNLCMLINVYWEDEWMADGWMDG